MKEGVIAEINTRSAIECMKDFGRNLNFELLDGSHVIKFPNGIFVEGTYNADGSYVGDIYTTNLRGNALNDFVSKLPRNAKKDRRIVRDHFLSVSYILEPKGDESDFGRRTG